MDCVLGYHLNPLTCGIAKFNMILAQQCGVPVLSVFDSTVADYHSPLLSVKTSEFRPDDLVALERWLDTTRGQQSLRIFLHAFSGSEVELKMIHRAASVYCGNSELIDQLRPVRNDLIEVWCPGTLLDVQRFNRAEISVFSFGMAHKVRPDQYLRLRTLLEQTGQSYCLYLSTALHDGTSFDESFAVAFEELKGIFSDRIYFLGYLSDTAVYNYLSDATFFAAFFERGVRANNTSVSTAMQCGAVVITNLDAYSPPSFVHRENILDIRRCEELPTDVDTLSGIRQGARRTALGTLGWNALVAAVRDHEQRPAAALSGRRQGPVP